MSIVESDGPPSWSLDASETGEGTKCPWVGVVEGTAGENEREKQLRLNFRRSLVALGEERGLISRTAAGNRAYIPSFIGNLWWDLLLGNHLNSLE